MGSLAQATAWCKVQDQMRTPLSSSAAAEGS